MATDSDIGNLARAVYHWQSVLLLVSSAICGAVGAVQLGRALRQAGLKALAAAAQGLIISVTSDNVDAACTGFGSHWQTVVMRLCCCAP